MPRTASRTKPGGNISTRTNALQRSIAVKNKIANTLPTAAASAASAQMVAQLMQDPEVVDALASLAAAGVHIGADVIEQSLPDLQKAAAATGTSLESAVVNAIQGVIDAIPILDDVEAVGQEAIAAADLGGAAAKAGSGILYSAKDIMNTLGSESSIIDQRVKLLQNAANAAMAAPDFGKAPIVGLGAGLAARTARNALAQRAKPRTNSGGKRRPHGRSRHSKRRKSRRYRGGKRRTFANTRKHRKK